ncbi:hypothetical protein EVAR_14735_1 [Eumeta japonica]|uniref:Uncharacterized protein n=1 Tax=Eumeta variegata TaxID=151549 RepID=A0A4C1TWE0_EUMVA|nr:hypothetical protein EVAR_14735_1 [Eumeta japonica]
MSESHGDSNQHRKDVSTANVASDSPVTDPGQVRGGNTEGTGAKFDGQRAKSGALKKSARYRSRSLSASSADSYSSASYTDDTCRNGDAWERCGLKDVATRVEKGMLLWCGRLERMNESRVAIE